MIFLWPVLVAIRLQKEEIWSHEAEAPFKVYKKFFQRPVPHFSCLVYCRDEYTRHIYGNDVKFFLSCSYITKRMAHTIQKILRYSCLIVCPFTHVDRKPLKWILCICVNGAFFLETTHARSRGYFAGPSVCLCVILGLFSCLSFWLWKLTRTAIEIGTY